MEGGGTYLYCIEDRNLYLLGILFPIVWTPGVLSMGTVASEVVVRLFHTDFNMFYHVSNILKSFASFYKLQYFVTPGVLAMF